MDMQQLVKASILQFDGKPINSVANLEKRTRSLFAEAAKLVNSNHKVPITFYVHTSEAPTLRITPQFPRDIIVPVLASALKQAPNPTALISVTEAWGMLEDDVPCLGTEQMREWVSLGNDPKEHPDACSLLVVSSMCNISGHGTRTSAGYGLMQEEPERRVNEPQWFVNTDETGTLIPPLQDLLTTIEDFDFLREKSQQPQPGSFDTAAKGW